MGVRPLFSFANRRCQANSQIGFQSQQDVIQLALEHLLRKKPSIAINIGSGQAYSVQQVVDAVRDVTGRPVLAQPAPRRMGDPAILVADGRRANELLGWAPMRSDLKTIVADAWRWHSQRFGFKKDPLPH